MERARIIDHDELTPREAAIAKIVLGPLRQWNPDIALRYLPIVRLVKAHGLADQVTDVGAGPVGIAPYLRRPVTNVDTDLPEPLHPRVTPVRRSVLDTGFGDRSCPCVISVDMLEHVPADVRQPALDELVRIAGRLLVVAAPVGAESQALDAEMARLFKAKRGAEYRYLNEHLEYGLPSTGDFRGYVQSALRRHGRQAAVRMLPNANLRLRSFIARRWINRGLFDKVAWVVLTWLSPVLARLEVAHRGRAYRQLAVVEFHD
jgi:hypothetical protein